MNAMRIAGALLIAVGFGVLAFRPFLGTGSDLGEEAPILLALLLWAAGAGVLLTEAANHQDRTRRLPPGAEGGTVDPALAANRMLRWRIARATVLATACMLLLMLIVTVVYVPVPFPPPEDRRSWFIAMAFVAVLSGGIGFAELIQRYRDNPARLFAAPPTLIYVCVNMAAAISALALVQVFQVFDKSAPHRALYEVLLAAFGSIAFFRSSLFTARVADRDVDVGPATLLKSLLATSDQRINLAQARDRVADVAPIMRRVDFARARAALPTLCFTVVENVPKEEQERVAAGITQMGNAADMTDTQRSIILGTLLMRVVGAEVLKSAVEALGDSIAAVGPAIADEDHD